LIHRAFISLKIPQNITSKRQRCTGGCSEGGRADLPHGQPTVLPRDLNVVGYVLTWEPSPDELWIAEDEDEAERVEADLLEADKTA